MYRKFRILPVAIVLFLMLNAPLLTGAQRFVLYKAKSGDGITIVLNKFLLPASQDYIDKFKELNKKKFDANEGMLKGQVYKLPVIILNYDGKSLESSLKNYSSDVIQKIEIYNKKVFSAELKKRTYKKDNKIWIPYLLQVTSNSKSTPAEPSERDKKEPAKKENHRKKSKTNDLSTANPSKNYYPIFGKKYAKIQIKDTKLKGHVFFIDPGHGGPDPGAIGKRKGHELHEDEYAYDVSLRLARNLLEHGAKVYVIVVDDNDGIRDEEYLTPSYNEYYYGGDSISNNQRSRLTKRAKIINKLYSENKSAKSCTDVTIHLDSRFTKKRIDIFFYYKEGSEDGKELANTLCETIRKKYDEFQPGRGYNGSVSSRNLLMLRELKPNSVYIELGNIQNKNDQYRFIDPTNRETIAKWLCEGLIKAVR